MQVLRDNWRKGMAALASLALLFGIVALTSGSSASTAPGAASSPRPPDPVRRTFALLTGVPQHGTVLGYRKAPVTLQFFADLQCIDSRRVMLGALPFLIRRFVRAGKLKIRFRSLETDTKHGGGWYVFREQQTAAMAAGKQNKLWNFIDVFYREQGPEFSGYVTEDFLEKIAMEAGVDVERWSRDRVPFQEDWLELSEADEALATAKHLESTPEFLIGRTGGSGRRLLFFSYEQPKVFEEAIVGLL
jgi:protein-disulfide isomerase